MIYFFIALLVICVVAGIFSTINEHNKSIKSYEYNRMEGAECAKRITESKVYEAAFRERYVDLGEPTIQIFFSDCWEGNKLPTRENCLEFFCGANSITVWQQQKKFLLLSEKSANTNFAVGGKVTSFLPESIQKPISFDTLISCEVTDDATVIHGSGLSTTKTSKLGMITRGAVGGALFGGVGALAGAMTANTSTETIFEADTILHNYKIHLTFNDFSCPLLTLEFGDGEMQMRQVLSVLNLIIKNS